MVPSEEVIIMRGEFFRQIRSVRDSGEGKTKLLISFNKVEFSETTAGYHEVSANVFFSELTFLLYIRKVVAGRDFERVKRKARDFLLSQLENAKYKLSLRGDNQTNDAYRDEDESFRKLVLLDKAYSILENAEVVSSTCLDCEEIELP